jgi:hypothetical protein
VVGQPLNLNVRSLEPFAMNFEDILKLLGSVAISFGGGAVIVVALSGWLADLWAKRILQHEDASLKEKIEDLRHELGLAKSSYDHYLDLILEYYRVFFRHYRSCQRADSADAHRQPDGKITFTKDEFLSDLDTFLVDWAAQEGKIRLLLPSRILALHTEAVDCFNRFKRAIDDFCEDEESHIEKKEAFLAVHDVKSRMEESLREFLRTEKLLK